MTSAETGNYLFIFWGLIQISPATVLAVCDYPNTWLIGRCHDVILLVRIIRCIK